MGFGCGFDMYPRLTQSSFDRERWASFIDDVCCRYIDGDESYEVDPNVTMKTNSNGTGTFIEFLVGEHPILPYDGTKFLRFSSKVSGPRTSYALPYIQEVLQLAKKRFGDRIKWWHEEADEVRCYYSWTEVNENDREFRSVNWKVRNRMQALSAIGRPPFLRDHLRALRSVSLH